MRGLNKVLFILLAALFLSGCWDGVQLDNRSFVTAMSIDTEEGDYLVALEMPRVSRDANNMEKSVKSNTHRSLNNAIYGVDAHTDKEIFMGHMKIALLGEELLENAEMLKHTLDTLARDRSISRTLLILAAEGRGADLIEEELEDEILMGVYISNFFGKKNFATLYRQTLDNLTKYFAEGKTAIIPKAEVNENSPVFSGAAVMKDYALKGWLSEDELRGLIWLSNKAGRYNINIHNENEYFSINIDKYKWDMNFFEIGDNMIYAVISIKIEGDIEEAPIIAGKNTDSIIQKAKDSIEADIKKAYEALYIRIGADGLNMERTLEKKNPYLYKKYTEDEYKSIMDITVLLGVDVIINSKGAAAG